MKPLIIANWKMNPANSKDAFDLASAVAKDVKSLDVDVVLCPPLIYIPEIQSLAYKLQTTNYKLQVGAQDCFWEQEGPYTGQVSPLMLKNLGCSYVILGHSERKRLGETAEMVAKKIQAALEVALIPVVCIGENIEKEMKIILNEIKDTDVSKIVFVYEPEGAISTEPGAQSLSPEQLEQALGVMRAMLLKKAGEEAVQKTAILYGGSVKAQNIQEFMEKGAQGALVGAASLGAQEFVGLVKNAVSM